MNYSASNKQTETGKNKKTKRNINKQKHKQTFNVP